MKREVLEALAEGKVEATLRQTRAMAHSLIPFVDLRDWLAIRLYLDEPDDQVSIEMLKDKLGGILKRRKESTVPLPSEKRCVELDARDACHEEALEQISNLGTFIGHPGATPAHVVSETVSLIEKFVDAAARTGIKRGSRSLSTVAEDVVAKSKRALPFMESLLAAGRAFDIEFKEDGDGSRILEAIRLERIEVIERMNAAEKEAAEWRQSSETWQKRALAVEARLSGPEETTEKEPSYFANIGRLTGEFPEAVRRMLNMEEIIEEVLPNVVEFEAPGIELRLEGKPDSDSICRLLKLVDAFTADNEAK